VRLHKGIKMNTKTTFSTDAQGRKFADVINDPRINFAAVLDFFDDPKRQQRMIDSEEHHERPALAGVIKDLERQPDVANFLANNDSHETTRFRQAVGVIVRIVMEHHGWKTTGRKGSLGKRVKTAPGTTTPGAYHNSTGLSKWFVRSEHYEKIADTPDTKNVNIKLG
jgi:hypothetical protein